MRAPPATHAVQLHVDARAHERDVVEHLREGFARGEAGLVITGADRWRRLAAGLQAKGLDPARLEAEGRLVVLDADATLAAIVDDDGAVSVERLHDRVGQPLLQLTAGQRVRAYGDMVDLLAARDQLDEAVRLELAWNDLIAGRPIALRCGYDLTHFAGDDGARAFEAVCAAHDAVLPVEDPGPLATPALRRRVARLERDAAALVAEAALRRRTEAHLDLVARASAALAGALDPGTIVDTLLELAVPALGDVAMVDLVDGHGGDGGDVERRVRAGRPDARRPLPLNVCALSTGQAALHARIDDAWRAAAATSPEHLALLERLDLASLVTVPIVARGRAVGALTLLHHGATGRRHDARDLAVAVDLAGRAAAALERARLDREARRALDRQRELERRKDELMAMLGHELRNPLAPILTALELMQRRGEQGAARERGIIERQARHLARLVDDLLDLSRIERGKVELRPEDVVVEATVARAIELAQPFLSRAQHALVVDVAPGLRVSADSLRLAQALGNLVANAAKYTPDGGRVEVRAAREGGLVRIDVVDDGLGLAPDLLERAFEPFVQGPRALDRAEGGLGIGLTVARRLVELHGGTIVACSPGPGQGSTFTLRVPALDAPAAAPPVPTGEDADPASDGPRRRRVLVVDDNVDAADLLGDALEAMGFDVAVAHAPAGALELAGPFAPDVALVDLGLPGMDGFELAGRLRGLAADLRLVALTGYGQDQDRERTRAAGFDAHLVKPAPLDTIVAAIGPVAA